MEDICLRYVELHDGRLTKVELEARSLRLEFPFLCLFALAGEDEEVWWARATVLVTDWASLAIDLPEPWTGYDVEGGELLEARYGSLKAFRFSGLHLNFGLPGTLRVVGGDGRFEHVELEKLLERYPRSP